MSLIKSISGIRGTIGGVAGESLSPEDILKFTTAFGRWLQSKSAKRKVVIGRDARISGEMVNHLVCGGLMSVGMDVVNLGLSTTPTVEMAVVAEEAAGGIIITASHNPKNWNALKLLNERGEFISAADGAELLLMTAKMQIVYEEVDRLGRVINDNSYIEYHIQKILNHPLVKADAIASRNFTIVVDGVNSSGSMAVPQLLNALGVKTVVNLFPEMNGHFPHNPEPLAENLSELMAAVKSNKADLGIAVDPDVDRLVLVSEDGTLFGEEYTLVAVADYYLKHRKGNTVSNMSSTRALKDVTEKYGGSYSASAVGEVNVVSKMKATQAVIGGEGNGGIIDPELHYGRDALVGIALFLSHLATSGMTCSVLRSTYPNYHISKNKIELDPKSDLDDLIRKISAKYGAQPQNTEDGLRIDFEDGWVHLRKSNTEPIIRIIAESNTEQFANNMAKQMMADMKLFS